MVSSAGGVCVGCGLHFKALLSDAPGFAEWSPRCHIINIPSGREVSLSRVTWAVFDRSHGGTHC